MAGKCTACGIEGQGKTDFLCERCADPEMVVVVCASCLARTKGGDEILEVVEKYTGLVVPRRRGVTIKLSSCATCGDSAATLRTSVYLLRAKHMG
jgi:hypothetical protein